MATIVGMFIYKYLHQGTTAPVLHSPFAWIVSGVVVITAIALLLVLWIISQERQERIANQENERGETRRAPAAAQREEKRSSRPSSLWLIFKWIIILAVVTICLLGGWEKAWDQINQTYMDEAVKSSPFPNYNPDPLAISPHLYEEDAKGLNDHSTQNIDHFDLVMNGDVANGKGEFGEEGHVRVPNSWNSWKKYWVSNEQDRYVGFLYSGSTHAIGPFGANLPPPDDERFAYAGREFMVQGKGTLRFEKVW